MFAWKARSFRVGQTVSLTASSPVSLSLSTNPGEPGLLRVVEPVDVAIELSGNKLKAENLAAGDYRVIHNDNAMALEPLPPAPLKGLWTKQQAVTYAAGSGPAHRGRPRAARRLDREGTQKSGPVGGGHGQQLP